mmetsp:Transcript_20217/g.26715  ORF Transcript_20217/g.26715 Transcript_20217/m.26715 type:complete len:473 (-) Transcript_20217:524-1942(-)|eukprot:CAMPEP_0117757098 /NCGR_PEP_ID=MMETSP0947-20121206/14509_1 /TAXON_ID=44440 /ORGANISM="Chattonella subsalsa, Strain CCMP2191" /LENGTH=472 /DNA_ID=CAMNT_0005576887 /DNA_START=177 /DNA_END=1595 /DNA_ORIENTATION=-
MAVSSSNSNATKISTGTASDKTGSDKEVLDLMHFFCLAWKEESSYRGSVCFNFTNEQDDSKSMMITVCVQDDGVKVFNGKPSNGFCTVQISMPTRIFLRVYSGKASASEITRMFLQRRIWVSNLNFSEVTRFAAVFDYSTSTWDRFHKLVDRDAEVDLGLPGSQLFSTTVLRALEQELAQSQKVEALEESCRELFTLWVYQERLNTVGAAASYNPLRPPWWRSHLLTFPGLPWATAPHNMEPIWFMKVDPQPEEGGQSLPTMSNFCWVLDQLELFISLLEFSKVALCREDSDEDKAPYLSNVMNLLSDPKVYSQHPPVTAASQQLWQRAPEGLRRMVTARPYTRFHTRHRSHTPSGAARDASAMVFPGESFLVNPAEADFSDWWLMAGQDPVDHRRGLRDLARFVKKKTKRFLPPQLKRTRPEVTLREVMVQRNPQDVQLAPALALRCIRQPQPLIQAASETQVPAIPWAWS